MLNKWRDRIENCIIMSTGCRYFSSPLQAHFSPNGWIGFKITKVLKINQDIKMNINIQMSY